MSDDPTPDEFADPANWHPIEEHPYLNDPPKVTPVPEPDDLRTRIAAAVVSVIGNTLGSGTELGLDVADAVIAELGLHIDSPANGWLQARTAMWKADDE